MHSFTHVILPLQGYSNERYVSILNHCFDDIERFIIRLQHAAAAMRELQIRSHKRGGKPFFFFPSLFALKFSIIDWQTVLL